MDSQYSHFNNLGNYIDCLNIWKYRRPNRLLHSQTNRMDSLIDCLDIQTTSLDMQTYCLDSRTDILDSRKGRLDIRTDCLAWD